MWKDFFYYSKLERYAIIALLFLIGLNFVVYFSISSPHERSITEEMIQEEAQLLRKIDSSEHHKRYVSQSKRPENVSNRMNLSAFNPNTVDSLSLIRMGFPVRVVQNLLKYRRAGGTFRKIEDLAKIYGLTEIQFLMAAPYVQLPDRKNAGKSALHVDSSPKGKPQMPTFEHVEKFEKGVQVELNTVDTADLKRIPGIGSGIARQIVRYRQRLGGFYSISQLREIPYVTEGMLRWFKLEETELEKLEINKAGLERLRHHPYMDFYKAKVILEHRRKRGKIKDISQLSLYEEFSKEDLERLLPYFSFD